MAWPNFGSDQPILFAKGNKLLLRHVNYLFLLTEYNAQITAMMESQKIQVSYVYGKKCQDYVYIK